MVAKVFARPRKIVEPDAGAVAGKAIPGTGGPGLDADRLEDESELYDWDLELIGTVRLLAMVELSGLKSDGTSDP